MARTINLGILAHVDAGKTSLTERLLQLGGVIDEAGSVDDGNTQTDSMALERQRGITIKSAVVSFVVGDVTVNLIDTPGHPDFIAEVERSLSVLDGAVLVISAVEGVQAQTRVLMRALRRLAIPTIVFVNKIDRMGARRGSLLREITERLTPAIVPVDADPTDILSTLDDSVLAAYVDGSLTRDRLHASLVGHTRHARVHPVFFGSATTGAGVPELMASLTEFLPSAPGCAEGPGSGLVFKVERGQGGEKIAYVRMFEGTLRVRDKVRFGDKEGKVTAISVFDRGPAVRRQEVSAGQIGKLWGLGEIRIGDRIGRAAPALGNHFSPPTLETVVLPDDPSQRGALYTALTQLAEQDPLINLRQDGVICLYGEVQKEVIQATLLNDYGIAVSFKETTPICIERVSGTGAAVEIINEGDNPYLATVGLRVEPGNGVTFRLEVELGSMPSAFFNAVEESVHRTLRHGPHGREVTDCVVTMTHSGYWARQSHAHGTFDKSMSSTAGDFRNLTALVLTNALEQAGTVVHEPMDRYRLEIPGDTLSVVQPVLVRLRAFPLSSTPRNSSLLLEGDIPAARVHELERLLPSLTRGEGVLLDRTFHRWSPLVSGYQG
ncbi:translation factor GTPase family protein [Kibdelosporangium persicum]|uniref:Oxytetracycline resistance protein OtrA n=1 Tax=Kibdelosporangium persicum TaxID=2698649 RepID=A0ABX2EXJ6_9PSEU|nr:TetM/TetW/TetO/TetS family tetracycline resistance ribosomal protection protein [Kibdelosporangium persicum]NRN63418.1 Oxytetracycline resistance protein OtrA [Kibdelosporangium persicum]